MSQEKWFLFLWDLSRKAPSQTIDKFLNTFLLITWNVLNLIWKLEIFWGLTWVKGRPEHLAFNYRKKTKSQLHNAPDCWGLNNNKNRGFRSSPPELFLVKDVLKTCSKFTGEHPCRGCSAVNLLHIFRTLFYKNTYERLFLRVPFKFLGCFDFIFFMKKIYILNQVYKIMINSNTRSLNFVVGWKIITTLIHKILFLYQGSYYFPANFNV